jgi:hypothetical protein
MKIPKMKIITKGGVVVLLPPANHLPAAAVVPPKSALLRVNRSVVNAAHPVVRINRNYQ